jgi:phage terminase large subunit
MGRIIIPYKPREAFIPYHESDKRFCLTVAHRRCGKTVARINKLIRKAIECTLPNPRFGYLAPFYVQAKDIAWNYLKHYSAPLLEYGGKVNEAELSVVLPHNNATIRLYGAENADRMRGVYWDGLVGDETQNISKHVLTQVIMPALADRGGWLDVAGTPKGWNNLLGELYKEAQANPDDWFMQVLRASETGILSEKELAIQRKLLTDSEYEQEFECSFNAAILGAIYGKWMAAADKEGRITNRVKHDHEYPVYTAWDLGRTDSTVIWFYQLTPNEVLIIDYYEFYGEGIGHYCDVLKSKPYKYHTHFVPQDAKAKLQAANGRSIIEQARKDHDVILTMLPETTHANRHAAARRILPICWFNGELCAEGVEGLFSYHYQYNADLQIFGNKPEHDWSSNPATAFELLARACADKVTTVKQLKDQEIRNTFFRLRRENNLEALDPYRVKPMGKRK